MRTYITNKSQTGHRIHKHFIFPQEPHPQSFAALVVMTNYYKRKDPETNPFTQWKIYKKHRREVLIEHLAMHGRYVCHYCNRSDLTDDHSLTNNHPCRVTIDHIIPIGKGGSLLSKKNMVVACSKCNNEKADKL